MAAAASSLAAFASFYLDNEGSFFPNIPAKRLPPTAEGFEVDYSAAKNFSISNSFAFSLASFLRISFCLFSSSFRTDLYLSNGC
jgi:hypothetical protein